MRVVVIGGSGHIGTYLTPRLVELGHEVINVTRGKSKPYLPHAAWNSVQQIVADREAEDAAGTFGKRISDLKADVVIDLMCFTLESAKQIVEAVRGQVQHFLHCGTMWIYGYNISVPATEEQPRRPFGKYEAHSPDVDAYLLTDYGVQKAAIEAYLLDEARRNRFPATALHPGHVVGPGHHPVNPIGNFNPAAFSKLARGEEVTLPNLGLETVHHVHGDDVAQAFVQAMLHWSASVGESFHVVSPAALTLRGYAESVAGWFGQTANLRFMPYQEWRNTVPEAEAVATWDHIAHSPNGSIAKAQRLLHYQPRYTSLQAIYETLMWNIEHGVLTI
jgi:nucleoside-diphosphate-sugar epimerase